MAKTGILANSLQICSVEKKSDAYFFNRKMQSVEKRKILFKK
jgi:hypothetical protein